MTHDKPRPTLKHLMVLKMLLENNYGISHSGGYDYSSSHFFTRAPDLGHAPNELFDWFEINKAGPSTSPLYQWGWTKQIKKPAWDEEKKSFGGLFHYSTRLYVPTPLAEEYWKTDGEALYDKLLKKEMAKRESVNRLVIVSPKKLRDGERKVAALARVIRETPKRLYVEVLQCSGYSDWNIFEGNRHEKHVRIDQIYIDGVTEEFYNQLVAVENDIMSDRAWLKSQMDAEIAEITSRYRDRGIQKNAEYADMLAPLIGTIENT